MTAFRRLKAPRSVPDKLWLGRGAFVCLGGGRKACVKWQRRIFSAACENGGSLFSFLIIETEEAEDR